MSTIKLGPTCVIFFEHNMTLVGTPHAISGIGFGDNPGVACYQNPWSGLAIFVGATYYMSWHHWLVSLSLSLHCHLQESSHWSVNTVIFFLPKLSQNMIALSNTKGTNCVGGQDVGGAIPYGIMAYVLAFGGVLWLQCLFDIVSEFIRPSKCMGYHIDVRFASIYHYDRRLFRERFLGPPGVSWL